MSLTKRTKQFYYRIPGMIRPCYVHTPTCYVYEYPILTGTPLGMYSMANNNLNMYPGANYYNSFGSGYRSLPVETPYSAAALALQGGKYPVTTMSVPNDLAYPTNSYYNSMTDYNPYRYGGMFGQRGMLM
jgi:hypothetical protein